MLLFTAALAAAGIAGGLLGQASLGPVTAPSWPAVVAFLVLLTAAGFPTLQFQYRDQVDAEDLFEAILVPAMFVLPPLAAVLVVGVALGVVRGHAAHPSGQGLLQRRPVDGRGRRRQPWSWRRCATAPPRRPPATCSRSAAAMAAITAVNVVALVGVLWLAGAQPFRSVLAGCGR